MKTCEDNSQIKKRNKVNNISISKNNSYYLNNSCSEFSSLPSKSKSFSVILREIDYNSLRAFQMSNNANKNKSFTSREILSNSNNPMKYPFGLKSKRFQWLTNTFINTDLKGNQKHYISQALKRSKTWSDLRKSNRVGRKRNIGSSIAYNYSVLNNINSKRTIEPQSDILKSEDYINNQKKILRSSSTGSIANLINTTPLEKKVKIRDRITKGNNLFSNEFYCDNFYKRQKGKVNLKEIKEIGGYAGNCQTDRYGYKLFYNIDNLNMNSARRRKIRNNMTDIFNLRESNTRYNQRKLKREYVFNFDVSQSNK